MEQIQKKKNYYGIILLGIAGIIAFLVIIHAILSLMAPGREMARLNKYYLPEIQDEPSLLIPDSLLYLAEEKSFLNSKILMSEYDSICLFINIPDSVLDISFKGLVLHSTPLRNLKIPAFISGIDPQLIIAMTSGPVRVIQSDASIVHEPIVVKKAPKDTIEAALMVSTPDTVNRDAVSFHYLLENGISIRFIQDSLKDVNESKILRSFTHRHRFNRLWSDLKYTLRFKVPPYNPEIIIRLPEEDAKTIYRAMPKKGQVVLRTGLPY